jgi:hypothetical protein
MLKLPLNLGESELRALFVLLRGAMATYPIQELKTNPGDYLILSCLHEFYGKLENRVRDVQLFGLAQGKKVRLSLKRHEAIALLHLLGSERAADDAPFLPALAEASYEYALVSALTAEINQAFFS